MTEVRVLSASGQIGSEMVLGAHYVHNILRRTIEDIGAVDASGNEAYIIGNPGRGLVAQNATANGFIPLEAVRDYDAVEVALDKEVELVLLDPVIVDQRRARMLDRPADHAGAPGCRVHGAGCSRRGSIM